MDAIASVTTALGIAFGLNGKVLKEIYKDILNKPYDEKIEKGLTYLADEIFDAFENHILNKDISSVEEDDVRQWLMQYSVWNSANTSYAISNATRTNPNTFLLYSAIYENGTNKNFSKEVFNQWDGEKTMTMLSQFPSMKYVYDFSLLVQEFMEKASSVQAKIDSFSGGFVGGGFGIKGAAKGIFMASVANAATELAYEIYQKSKLDIGAKRKMFEEFMHTKESRAFIRELIILDVKFMFFTQWQLLYNALGKKHKVVGTNTGASCLEGLFEKHCTSSKLYAIALAKQMNLSVMPLYEGMDEYYQMEPLALLENAILEFPYDRAYYEKYCEFGGEFTEELQNFATLHMVNISDIYEANQERFRKEEEERLARKRAEDEKQRQEEKKRKEVEKTLKEKYGEMAADYPDLFMQLANNSVFLEYGNRTFENHHEVNEAIFLYLGKHFSDVITNFHSVTSTNFISKQRNLFLTHRDNAINASTVLFFYDNTLFGSAKDGFVVTKDKVYVKNFLSNPESIAIKDIKSIEKKESYVYINGTIKVEFTSGSRFTCNDMVNILTFCVCNLLLISNKPTPAQPLCNNNNNQWVCRCGSANSAIYKYCPQCGAEKPIKSADWVCPNCQNKNPSANKFCGNCGTRKPV